MYTKEYLFPGKNTLDQLNLISDILGTPDQETLSKIPNRKAQYHLSRKPKIDPPPLKERLGFDITAEGEDIVRRMCEWDPDRRLDVVGILEHPFPER